MITKAIRNVYVAQHRVDFRKGFQGLLAEAFRMELDPYAGDCVVFVHKSFRRIKIICGHSYGAWILIRRFEGGRLQQQFPFLVDPSFIELSSAELELMLDGAQFTVTKRAKKWKERLDRM